jgi:hypothetical protein
MVTRYNESLALQFRLGLRMQRELESTQDYRKVLSPHVSDKRQVSGALT